MKWTSMFALALALLLWQGPADATATTPLVPNDVGHWLNLEHRTGKLAPAISGNRLLVQNILVVERSLPKIDAYVTEARLTSGCHQLILPYFRIIREPISEIDAEGNILFRKQRSAYPEQLAAGLFDNLRKASDENRLITADFNGETASIRGTRLDDWVYLFALYPESELLAMRNNLARTVTLITCISILVTMAMLFWALKSLLITPVQKLSRAAGEIGKGEILSITSFLPA